MPANKFRTPNLLSFGKMKCSVGFIVIISDILKLFSIYFKVTSDYLTESEHVNCVKVQLWKIGLLICKGYFTTND
jgi:hypothetical protein